MICCGLLDFVEQIHHLSEHWNDDLLKKNAGTTNDLESEAHQGNGSEYFGPITK